MIPARGRCLVRKVETSETYAGSKIVLPEAVREKIAAQQVEILAVGADASCDDERCERAHEWRGQQAIKVHPLYGRPTIGDWALIAPRSLTESGTPDTYLVHHDDVLAVLSPD